MERPYTVIIRAGSKFNNLKGGREITALNLQKNYLWKCKTYGIRVTAPDQDRI